MEAFGCQYPSVILVLDRSALTEPEMVIAAMSRATAFLYIIVNPLDSVEKADGDSSKQIIDYFVNIA